MAPAARLLQHLKEHRLQCDLRAGDRLFYFTTCGWMMWNWLASGLATGTTLMLFDGSPFGPTPNALFDYAAQEKFTLLWHVRQVHRQLQEGRPGAAPHS